MRPILLMDLTGLVFAPMIGQHFVRWDDPRNFIDNPRMQAPGMTSQCSAGRSL